MIVFIGYIALILLVIFLMGPFVTLIHELGHGLSTLLFIKETPIEIFIGTFSDKNKTLKPKIGRLHFFIKYNHHIIIPKGLCKSNKSIDSFFKNFIIIISGLTANIITAIIAIYFLLNLEENGFLKYIILLFIFDSLVAFFVSIVPSDTRPENGKSYQTDGKQLMLLIRHNKIFKYATKGDLFFIEKKYQLAL